MNEQHRLNLSLQASDDYFKRNNENGKFIHPLETLEVEDLCYNDSQIFDSQYIMPTPIASIKRKSEHIMNDTLMDKPETGI